MEQSVENEKEFWDTHSGRECSVHDQIVLKIVLRLSLVMRLGFLIVDLGRSSHPSPLSLNPLGQGKAEAFWKENPLGAVEIV